MRSNENGHNVCAVIVVCLFAVVGDGVYWCRTCPVDVPVLISFFCTRDSTDT